ncbi:hypothetical protein QE394_000726 [Arthrobacter sp. SORGH_AS 212]|uniref:hypothetical protein n=1 Tax=Pseudarthrobacter sp. SORGH_AS 212 TaxID=3041777 RepID=UPI002787B3CD|nr:hypothetical protein [Arthrobacter sp. SORGH_AS_0212]
MPKSGVRKNPKKTKSSNLHDKERFDQSRRLAQGFSSLFALERAMTRDPQLLAVRLSILTSQRRKAINQGPSLLTTASWQGLALFPAADLALSVCGGDWPEMKNSPNTDRWSTHVRWGLDQFAEIQRLIAAGMTYGALMTTRLFLERWTINIASSHSIPAHESEMESAYITRVWKVFGTTIKLNMGHEWAWLSECLHGRDRYQDVLRADLFVTGKSFSDAETKKFAKRVSEIAHAVLLQVFANIDTMLLENKVQNVHSPMRVTYTLPPAEVLNASTSSPIFKAQFAPLDPLFVFSKIANDIVKIGQEYRANIASFAADDEEFSISFSDVLSALLERRGRSVELAVKALTSEGAIYDPESGRGYLLTRLYRFGAIAQGAILVAGVSPKPEAQAMRTAAAALESAWNLWLDDSHTSLGCVRGLLEQTARARVHRLKPAKAEKLEANRNSPNRWLEAASLNRLNEFGRALGEFSHLKTTSRRDMAFKRLIDVQERTAEYPEQTARLHALETSAYFLAKEVHSRLRRHYPNLGEAFLKTVTLFDADGHKNFEDEFMTRALSIRDKDWGDPDFKFF